MPVPLDRATPASLEVSHAERLPTRAWVMAYSFFTWNWIGNICTA